MAALAPGGLQQAQHGVQAVAAGVLHQGLGLRRAQAAVAYLTSLGISRSRLEAVVSYGETRPIIATNEAEVRNRRTVTEVSGFVKSHPLVLNGKYAAIIWRDYVQSGVRPHEGVQADAGAGG